MLSFFRLRSHSKNCGSYRSHTEVERQLRAQIFAMQQQLAAGGGGGGASTGGGGAVDSAEVEDIRLQAERASRNAAQLEAKVASLVRFNAHDLSGILSS